jgi:hypothetical protein
MKRSSAKISDVELFTRIALKAERFEQIKVGAACLIRSGKR